MRILVIEDDEALRNFVVRLLKEEQLVVDAVGTAAQGRLSALTNHYDGIAVDIDLPDGNGVDIVRAVRAAGKTVPIMIFTGSTNNEAIVSALDAGADDYITKPSGGSVIQARVRALIRRGQVGGQPRAPHEPLQVGNVRMNVATRRVTVGDTVVQLTPKETLLLQEFLLHPGEVVPRSELLEKVWNMHLDPESNVVDTHVSRLRTKLRTAGATTDLHGVRAIGFALDVTTDEGP